MEVEVKTQVGCNQCHLHCSRPPPGSGFSPFGANFVDRTQGVSNMQWRQMFAREASVKTVRTEFCRLFGLGLESVQLFHEGHLLTDQPLLQVRVRMPLCFHYAISVMHLVLAEYGFGKDQFKDWCLYRCKERHNFSSCQLLSHTLLPFASGKALQ